MKESQQQIAREAADEIYPSRLSQEWQMTYDIILSAIERAQTEFLKWQDNERMETLAAQPQRSELSDEQIRACICTIGDKINPKCPTHNPQRSEQQEWTPEHCEKYFGVTPKLSRDISYAITTALTAERERREQAEKALESYTASVNNADRHNARWQERAERAEQQLLSALAAIEKIDKVINGEEAVLNGKISGNLVTRIRLAIKQAGDLSLLHEHDAQLLKEHGL